MVRHFDMCTMLTIAVVFICTTNDCLPESFGTTKTRRFFYSEYYYCNFNDFKMVDDNSNTNKYEGKFNKNITPLPHVAAKEVCYEGFGCFDTSLPCNKISLHLPQSPKEINTEFLLYTPENPKTEQVINWKDDDSIVNSNFQGSRETKFFIHGFTDDVKRPVNQDLKDALLSIGNFNVILVNWKGGSRAEIAEKLGNIANLEDVALSSLEFLKLLPDYLQARQNTRLVGRQIGELSRKLQQLTGAPFARMHLIGHSLGAHVAGYAGENVNGQYGRITGLDPAGPGYRPFSFEKGCLLEKSDAAFVDIIHTDHILGIQTAIGHQDFYPSGGNHQVSCPSLDVMCDHIRAVDFFIESITTKCKWNAYPCGSWLIYKSGFCRLCLTGCSRMGYYADLSSTSQRKFMLATNKQKPYCKE